MLDDRSRSSVCAELLKIGFHVINIECDTIEIRERIMNDDILKIRKTISNIGLELIYTRKDILTEKIKCIIIDALRSGIDIKIKFSSYLEEKLNLDYSYMSRIFSKVEKISIEKFIIINKIEIAKELIAYNDLSIREISEMLGYQSVPHLCTQFKKITGITTTAFKRNIW